MNLKKLGAALSIAVLALVATASSASAATLISFTGNTNGSLAQGTGSLTLSGGTLTGSLTNTSPFDARLMGFGFDLGAGNLNGYSGSASSGFVFSDADFGNVPQFPSATIDFGYAVNCSGPDCTLNGGGSPNNGLAPGGTVNFTVSGNFAGFTEAQIASALYVRFQRVGQNGQLSDVSRVTQSTVPEPASMLLLGTGLLAAARARRRKA